MENFNKGQGLILVVILIAIATILITSTSFFLSEILSQHRAEDNKVKSIYAARAGIMAAIVDYENNGSITEVTDVQISGNIYYSLGGSGMFF